MLFQIKLAGKIVEIQSVYELIYIFCSRYVIADEQLFVPDIIVKIEQADIDREMSRLVLLKQKGYFDNSIYDPGRVEITVAHKKIVEAMLQFDTILMHGSVIAVQGNGYMISAPKGVGKSTRTDMWIKNIPDSIVVNGDKPLIKVTPESVYACGSPWAGKEGWETNISVPLRAILVLERTNENEKGSIEELSIKDAFSALVSQTYQLSEPESIMKTLRLLKSFQGKLKVYRYRSALTVEDVLMAYGAVK